MSDVMRSSRFAVSKLNVIIHHQTSKVSEYNVSENAFFQLTEAKLQQLPHPFWSLAVVIPRVYLQYYELYSKVILDL